MLEAVDPQLELGFKFVQELAKQLITLSTGILALSITFTKDLVREVPGGSAKWLKVAWVLLLGSILAGIFELSALTGALLPLDGVQKPMTSVPPSARVSGAAQLLLFVAAIGFIIAYGFGALLKHQQQDVVSPSSEPAAAQPHGRG